MVVAVFPSRCCYRFRFPPLLYDCVSIRTMLSQKTSKDGSCVNDSSESSNSSENTPYHVAVMTEELQQLLPEPQSLLKTKPNNLSRFDLDGDTHLIGRSNDDLDQLEEAPYFIKISGTQNNIDVIKKLIKFD